MLVDPQCPECQPSSYPSCCKRSGRKICDLNNTSKDVNGPLGTLGTVLTRAPFLTIHVESTGPGPGARIRSVQIGFLKPDPAALYLPLEDEHGNSLPEARAEAASLLLSLSEADWWAFGDFDRRVLYGDLGVHLGVRNAWALQHAYNSADATRQSPLKREIAVRTGRKVRLTAEDTLTMSVHDPEFIEYTVLAAAVLAECVKDWMDALGWDRRRLDEWLHREQRISDACHDMSLHGLPLDQAEAERLLEMLERQAAAHRKVFAAIAGEDANPRSSQKMMELVKSRGVELPTVRRKRPDGTSYYSETMSRKHLHCDDELVNAIQSIVHYEAAADTLRKWMDSQDEHGLIHSSFNPQGCRTGRWTSSRPNFQNVSKASEQGDSGELMFMRGVFKARPHHVWVQGDLSQIEYRMAAAMSGDANMLSLFDRGEDLHMYAARALHGKDKPTKGDRKIAKGIGFGKLYGENPRTSAEKHGVTETEMQERVAAYNATFPQLESWCQSVAAAASDGWTAPNPYGRSFPVTAGYIAVNYTVQSTAREVFCEWMLNVIDAGYGPYLVAGVHDELIAEVPEDMAEEVRQAFIDCAAKVQIHGYEGLVQIVAEATIARGSWADAYAKD